MLLLAAGGYIAYTLWKKQQAATSTGSTNAAVSGPAASPGPVVSGPAAPTVVDDASYDEIDVVPVGWGPSWVTIMPGGGRRGGHRHHGGGGHRGRH
jgi:hypothetical protein